MVCLLSLLQLVLTQTNIYQKIKKEHVTAYNNYLYQITCDLVL